MAYKLCYIIFAILYMNNIEHVGLTCMAIAVEKTSDLSCTARHPGKVLVWFNLTPRSKDQRSQWFRLHYSPEGDEEARYPGSSPGGRKETWVLFLLFVCYSGPTGLAGAEPRGGQRGTCFIESICSKPGAVQKHPHRHPRNSILTVTPGIYRKSMKETIKSRSW